MRRRGMVAGALAGLAVLGGQSALGLVVGPPPKERPKFAELRGANEVPGPGDRDGRGSATLILPDARTICYALLVTGIAKPVAAHVHRGRAGVAGPIVVALKPPPRGRAGAVAGCVRAPAAVVAAIRNRPAAYYVNVHTGDFPDGALRGQLFVAR